MIFLIFINTVLGILLLVNMDLTAKISLFALLILVDTAVCWFLLGQYKNLVRAKQFPSKQAQVKMQGHALRSLKPSTEWQSAALILKDQKAIESKEPDLEVEIGLSSVSLPNTLDSFDAQIFFDGKKPVLLLSENAGILAVITGVLVDRRNSV